MTLRASQGGKARYSAPGEWVGRLSRTTRIRSASGKCTSLSSRMQFAHANGEVLRGPPVGDLYLTPGSVGVEKDEQVDPPVASILAVIALMLPRHGLDRLPYLTDELGRALVETDNRALRIRRLRIQVSTSSMRATYSPSICGMHHLSLRHGLRSFSVSRRRTVSREMLSCSVSLTSSSANSSRVQRARPSGGLEQAVAISRASSLPESLRDAPGRGSSLNASSRLPTKKRRLVRYTVDPPTPTLIAMSSSPAPASAASKICARLSLRAACLPALRSAVSSPRSAWLSSIQ